QSEGIESHAVDPASIATSRRRRRAKTDRIDGEALVRALLAHKRGEPRVCAMVKAPTPQEGKIAGGSVVSARGRYWSGSSTSTASRIAVLPRGYRVRTAAPRPAGAAGRAPDRRWSPVASSSEGPASPRAGLDLLRDSGEFPMSDEELDDTATTVYEGIC